MAPLMFAGLIVGMIIGYPAAFSIGAVGLFFGLIGIELGLISPVFLGNLTFQMFSVISNDLLLAIPFFTLMGAMTPVTLPAALAQQNAEALFGIALTQLLRPGAPVLYGAFTSNVDMKSGAPACRAIMTTLHVLASTQSIAGIAALALLVPMVAGQ